MKAVTAALITEQVKKAGYIPAFKAVFQQYGHPTKSEFVRYNKYDWRKIYEGDNLNGLKGCCTKAGTLILTDGDNVYRYPNPSFDTDFSDALGTASDTPDFGDAWDVDICSNPVTDETLIFRINPGNDLDADPLTEGVLETYVEYKSSIDDGVTWGDWINLRHAGYILPSLAIATAFNVSGDVCVATSTTPMSAYTKNSVYCKRRISGTWDTTTNPKTNWLEFRGWREVGIVVNMDDFTIWADFVMGGTAVGLGQGLSMFGAAAGGCGGGSNTHSYGNCPVLNTCLNMTWDGDWIITVDLYQTNFEALIRGEPTGIQYSVPREGDARKSKSKTYYVIMGDGHAFDKGVLWSGGEVNLADANVIINNLKDISSFSFSTNSPTENILQSQQRFRQQVQTGQRIWSDYPTPNEMQSGYSKELQNLFGNRGKSRLPSKKTVDVTPYANPAYNIGSGALDIAKANAIDWARFQTQIQLPPGSEPRDFATELDKAMRLFVLDSKTVYERSSNPLNWETGTPYSYIHRISNVATVLSVCDAQSVYFLHARSDLDIADGVFSHAFKLENNLPLAITSNSDYVFAFNSGQMWMSPLPDDWTPPSAGTGAGGYFNVTTERIIAFKENAESGGQVSTFEIILGNHDGYFNSSEDVFEIIKKGSLLTFHQGFKINNIEVITETKKYFIDNWGYSREPAREMFMVRCIDAWGLLQNYIFPKYSEWNILTDTYTIYDLIEKMVKCIGGTFTYQLRSVSSISLYPPLTIQPGDNAANVLRRLLTLIPDSIYFDGVNASLRHDKVTDTSVYTYSCPSI